MSTLPVSPSASNSTPHEVVTRRTIDGHEYAIEFCPEVPVAYRDAYAFTRDGQVIEDRLLHREARELLNKAAPIPAGWEAHKCAHCETVILVRSDTPETPVCRGCPRMQSEKAAHEAQCVINDLRKGEPPFDALTLQERAEQLAQLTGEPDPIERQRIELEDEQYHRELVMRREIEEAQEPERWADAM